MNRICHLPSPVGWLELESNGAALTRLSFCDEAPQEPLPPDGDPILQQAIRELNAYFEGTLQHFTVPVDPSGTPFRKMVWNAMRSIPYGQTATYGELAQVIGSPNASRAVGGACHNNPVAIILPCHRVIGTNGFVTGYAGGAWRKQILLKIENED